MKKDTGKNKIRKFGIHKKRGTGPFFLVAATALT
jgi:hypothetical protein